MCTYIFFLIENEDQYQLTVQYPDQSDAKPYLIKFFEFKSLNKILRFDCY